MRFKMPSGLFAQLSKKALQFRGRRTDSHPGYGLALIEVTKKGLMRISVGSPESGVRVVHKLTDYEAGKAAVDLEYFDRLTSHIPKEGSISVSLEPPKMRIVAGSLRMDFPAFPEGDFMTMPRPPRDGWIDIERSQISDIMNHVSWATASSDARPALAGVHLMGDRTEASNGHVMGTQFPGILPEGQDIVVGSEGLSNLTSLVSEDKTKIYKMFVDSRHFWIRGNGWASFLGLLNTKYPSTDGFIFEPDENNIHHVRGHDIPVYEIKVNRLNAIAIARRISGTSVSNEQKEVGASARFIIIDGRLHLKSHYAIEDLSRSIIVDEILDWAEGNFKGTEPFEELSNLGLYAFYLKQSLEALESQVISIMWSKGGTMPVQFQDHENGIVSTIMPRSIYGE